MSYLSSSSSSIYSNPKQTELSVMLPTIAALSPKPQELIMPSSQIHSNIQPESFLPHLIFPPNSQPSPPPPPSLPLMAYTSVHPPGMAYHIPSLHYYIHFHFTWYNHHSFLPYISGPLPPYHLLPPTTCTFPAGGIFFTGETPKIPAGDEKAPVSRFEIIQQDHVLKNPDDGKTEKLTTAAGISKVRILSSRCINGRKNFPPRMKNFPPRILQRECEKSLRLRSKLNAVKKLEWKPKDGMKAAVSGVTASPPPPPPTRPPSSAEEESELSMEKTTLMIKNIPNPLRRDFLLKFLDTVCLESKDCQLKYDFVYLPIDFRTKDNLGYAFVNLPTSAGALKLMGILQNHKWASFRTDGGIVTSKKICQVCWAKIQGKNGLIKRFENSCFRCDDSDFLPVVLDPPRNGLDPNPSPPRIVGSFCKKN